MSGSRLSQRKTIVLLRQSVISSPSIAWRRPPREGSHGNPHRTPKIHWRAWRRRGCVATRCARSAGGEATDHWIPGGGHGFGCQSTGRCLCATTARTWMDRGRTIAIEYRWAEGRNERYAEIATEFVRLKVNVILTWGTAA